MSIKFAGDRDAALRVPKPSALYPGDVACWNIWNMR